MRLLSIQYLANNDGTVSCRYKPGKNWVGFVVVLAIMYALIMVMSFVMQILLMTFILICVLPIFMAAISMYYSVIQFAMFAQAYKDGQNKLNLDTVPT